MSAYMMHELSHKGREVLVDRTDFFVVCRCGIKIIYDPVREDPWKKLKAHINAVNTESNNLESSKNHTYKDTVQMNGITYVRCDCGWKKKLKPYKDPKNVWEGHRGFTQNQEIKATRNVSKFGSKRYEHASSNVNRSYRNSWSSNYQKASWDEIQPIANEIFGGTVFALSVNTK
jgi:CDGSH-type Zn-finger protein